MLTSQPTNMLMELPNLLRKYPLKDAVGCSDGQKYFNKYIAPRYLKDESRAQRDFCAKTGLGKYVYQELRGVIPIYKIKGEDTLLHVAYGLRLTSEEAFMLFLYSGRILIFNDPVWNAIYFIILKLDNIRIDKQINNPVAELERLIGENNLHLR